ncbi:hypothetical protein K1T71_012860 [Dendrolimus kikuchii]|uniref:Uncharacterized protein n=1 Tax=Dendrolimus kikuchii TaxID=765133 RepID=A0ACC1CIE8_9NEOP|nr:hypothetical protein K1T71_012860 [Dendrolimus kikuchii]
MDSADCKQVIIDGEAETFRLKPRDKVQKQRPPASPVNRSKSLFDCLRQSQQNQTQEAEDDESNSTDSQSDLSEYRTLPIVVRKSDRRARRLNTQLLEAVRHKNDDEVEKLLKLGAHPDSTCKLYLVSAVHIAAVSGGDTLSLLLRFGAKKMRTDKLGRTPLLFAAWAGNAKQLGILLDFPEDLAHKVEHNITEDEVMQIKKLSMTTKDIINLRCHINIENSVPKEWLDNIEHECKSLAKSLSILNPNWTPLHAASSSARHHCTRLLLLAGADPSCRDIIGRTALDVAGSDLYQGSDINPEHFTEVIRQLTAIEVNTCSHFTFKKYNTILHTAVELESLEAVKLLVEFGVPLKRFNKIGLTPLHLCVKKKLKDHLQIMVNYDKDVNYSNMKDEDGNTILHSAVIEKWNPGICIALEIGIDVLAKNNIGETAIHIAAAYGDIGILDDLFNAIKNIKQVDYPNNQYETPLFKAINYGHLKCVKKLLKDGASTEWLLPKGVNVFHVAAELGHTDILKAILDQNYSITRAMINNVTCDDRKYYGPIHFAVTNNHPECVKLLLSYNAYVSLRTQYGIHSQSTPLHIAAKKNILEIAKILVKFDKSTVHNVDCMGWSPLHMACQYRSKDLIKFLVQEGADLSMTTEIPKKSQKTSIDIIVNNLSKPTEFLEDVFDQYIYCNNCNFQDPECEVIVDYNVLMPDDDKVRQIKVIKALLETGNRYGQRRLLLHPLLESFLYLKWKSLLPFFYIIMALYGCFVISLTFFIVSSFFYKDTNVSTPKWLDATIWKYLVYITVFFIGFQELLYINITKKYLLNLDTWAKLGSVTLAVIVPNAIESAPEEEWPRHIATMALLLSWLELLFLLSRFPNFGFYVLMFMKVSANVIKILLTFAFLLIGFSLSFMVQFRSETPFDNPWAALMKTMVMMTSEFDYDDLVKKDSATSLTVIKITFLVFLVLAAIVLMNLMVGVAVNDLHDLEVLGNIRRLQKQVEFLVSLEALAFNNFFKRIVPKKVKEKFVNSTTVSNSIRLRPNNPFYSYYQVLPAHIRDGLFDKVQSNKNRLDNDNSLNGLNLMRDKLDDIHKDVLDIRPNVVSKNTTVNKNINFGDIISPINNIDLIIRNMKKEINDTKTTIEVLNAKVDMILNKLQNKK